ncbi:MAG: type IV secretory system conjugative DNA transfer family protein [Parcubacteria group bacterium]|nr:type IV secretory system conjugative DNA transfer family protein [Parcubacteria group bacterium]
METFQGEMPKFKTPEEEVVFLRREIARHEKELDAEAASHEREHAAVLPVREYGKKKSEEVLASGHAMKAYEAEKIALDLAPESHDEQMNELFGIMLENGIKNALSVVERLSNPHIDDDFHRFLVQYIKAGYTDGVNREELLRALHMKLFEITLPQSAPEESEKQFKEMVTTMAQFYAGMLSVADTDEKSAEKWKRSFTLELAISGESEDMIFYAGVPDTKADLFEKQLLAAFPRATLKENPNDYNIFVENGASAASYAAPAFSPALSLKTYEAFDSDPLSALLNSFSKIKKTGEGAAVQIVLAPIADYYIKRYSFILDKVKKGVPVKKAVDMPEGFAGGFGKAVKELVFGGDLPKKDIHGNAVPLEPHKIDEEAIKHIEAKIGSHILGANIRIIASAGTESRAKDILSELESSFNQFSETRGNGIKFERVKKEVLRALLHRFSYRLFSDEHNFPLNIKELTTLFHFPVTGTTSRELKEAKAGSAPAPMTLSREGVVLGSNRYRNIETDIHFADEDRMRHLYVIGQTGTGKTTLLKNMIAQDIVAGNGVCMIDPHGSDIEDVLSRIPEHRMNDVIYFDPGATARPMGLNMLEYDARFPEQKTFVVNELFSIFQKLYGAVPESMGPMFEQYFRNATMLVIEDPESGSTLLDVSRVLADTAFRALKLSRSKNPVVTQFWTDIAEKAGGEGALANIVPYITSKFDVFLANDIMRPIVAQQHSAFNFRQIMDERKILLVNLSKGRLGDINSNLIGLIIVGKILMAALSRVDVLRSKPADFFLYIDEFQNITTDSIATILSEARKYRLSLTIANQFIAQLDEKIKNAVFGNVGSLAVFRVGADDAEYLAKQFAPTFTAEDIMKLDNRNAYLKLLANGQPSKPFNIETASFEAGQSEQITRVKEHSYQKYGRDRNEVEAEIMKKYRK